MATKEVIWDAFGWLVMAEKEQIRRKWKEGLLELSSLILGWMKWYRMAGVNYWWMEWLLCTWVADTPPLIAPLIAQHVRSKVKERLPLIAPSIAPSIAPLIAPSIAPLIAQHVRSGVYMGSRIGLNFIIRCIWVVHLEVQTLIFPTTIYLGKSKFGGRC